jgi:hypothetical protein
MALSYLLYDIPVDHEPIDLTPIKALLECEGVKRLFLGLCSDRQSTLVEQMLLMRGTLTEQITELVKDNALSANSDQYYTM